MYITQDPRPSETIRQDGPVKSLQKVVNNRQLHNNVMAVEDSFYVWYY